ncbi:MAG: hypothetical protein ABI866_08810 [Dokdonella sp.]
MNVQQENVLIAMRLWSLGVGELAREMASKASEEVARPLSDAQIHRALEAHRKEHAVCLKWLLDEWDNIDRGDRPSSDSQPVS